LRWKKDRVELLVKSSNNCGLTESLLGNITLRNVHLKLDGGVREYKREVPEEAQDYPEVFVYGRILHANIF